VLTGTVHSGVALAMAKIAREAGLPTLITNCRRQRPDRPRLCAPNIFRSSFGNSQVRCRHRQGPRSRPASRDAVTFTWRYAAGNESVEGFKETFTAGRRQDHQGHYRAVPGRRIPIRRSPKIASLKPTAVYSFFAGGGAVKYIKDYAGAKLNDSIQLWGPGFPHRRRRNRRSVRPATASRLRCITVESLDNAENKAFRAAYKEAFKRRGRRLCGAGL